MTDSGAPPLYRFRWDNMDLDDFIEIRQAQVALLRRQAADLLLKADAIDEQTREWRQALVEQGNGE